jgi:hypothetical protein
MRAGLHPSGLARWILNLGQVRATFDAPFDVASSELAFELAYPADPFTEKTLRELAVARR